MAIFRVFASAPPCHDLSLSLNLLCQATPKSPATPLRRFAAAAVRVRPWREGGRERIPDFPDRQDGVSVNLSVALVTWPFALYGPDCRHRKFSPPRSAMSSRPLTSRAALWKR